MKIIDINHTEYRITIEGYSFDENKFPFIVDCNTNVKHICLQYLKYLYGIERYYCI